MSIQVADLPAYPIPLDGQPHVISLPAWYEAHGLIVNNAGTVGLTVTSGRGERWTVAPVGDLSAPLPVSQAIFTFVSDHVDPRGAQAAATFTQALITVLSNTSTATSALADVALLATTDTRAVTSFSQSVSVPPEIVSLTISFVSGNFDTALGTEIKGDQSGIVYWHLPSNANSQVLFNFNAPFFAGADTSVTISVYYAAVQGNARTVAVWGHSYAIGPSLVASGSIAVAPSPAFYPWPVAGIVAAAPAYSGFAAVNAPAALSPVLSLTLVNAGLYRLEYNLFTDDGPGQGKFIFLQLPDGSQIEAAGPYGARGVITALSVTASAVCKVFSGTVTTVGSRYSALLRAYAL